MTCQKSFIKSNALLCVFRSYVAVFLFEKDYFGGIQIHIPIQGKFSVSCLWKLKSAFIPLQLLLLFYLYCHWNFRSSILETKRCTCPKNLWAKYWWRDNKRLHWTDGSYETINNRGKHLCLFQSCTLHRGERSSHSLSKRA